MPTFDMYKRINGFVKTNGIAKKIDGDVIMDATWWDDIQSRMGFLYDWYHDDHKTTLDNLNSPNDSKKVPIDIKYIVSSSQTFNKDAVTYHLQLRPHQKCNVSYYQEFFGKRYGSTFPAGLYIDIPDNRGVFNRWLVVGLANYNDPQFSTYEILRCDYVLDVVIDGVMYKVPVVLRSQNSYNSGLWTDYRITAPEDQQKFIAPLNRITENLFYDQRLIIDGNVLTEPRAWKISKVNRISPNGLTRITLAQDKFDEHRDYIELDESGDVVGKWAGYYDSQIIPEPYSPESVSAEIQYAGVAPQLKVGGSYKKFTAIFDTDADYTHGTWSYEIDGQDASSLVTTLSVVSDDDSQIKIKFIGDDSYIGKILIITYTTNNGLTVSLEVAIVSL